MKRLCLKLNIFLQIHFYIILKNIFFKYQYSSSFSFLFFSKNVSVPLNQSLGGDPFYYDKKINKIESLNEK